MKKSLKVIATATLAFSMFASVAMAAETTPTAVTTQAAVKTSKDFTDLVGKDAALLAKIDALLAKGFMDGKSETTFDITGNMTRAEAAKLVAKIFNLTVGTETTSSFKDVDGTDASIAWSVPFIEAAKKAGIIDGMTDTTFAPKENVTLGQLATLIVKGFGKGADVKTTTPWYQGYLDVAKAAGVDLGTDGAKLATRGDLVVGSYAADVAFQNINKPSKYAVAEVKAVGAKKLAVTLNGPVDTAVATFTVTRDGSTATFDAKAITWDAAKKVATITLDSALIDATYAVTIGGVTVDDAKKTASVVATKEKLTKIEITTASETLPLQNGVAIDFKATNQYGEATARNASSFTVSAGGKDFSPVSGKQQVKLNLIGADDAHPVSAKGDKIPLTIIDTETGIQTNKIFTVGEAAIVSKIEIGDLVDTDNAAIDGIKVNGSGRLKVTAFDQYGVAVTDLATLNGAGKGITVVVADTNLQVASPAFVNDTGDTTSLSLSVPSTAAAKDVTVTLISNGSGQSATKVVKVAAPKVPASVEFGAFTTALAQGDVNKYVPLVVKNAAGDVMTPDEIVAAADKFTIYAVGGVATLATPVIATSGDDRGKIQIARVDNKGNGSIVIQLKDKPEVKATISISAADARYADRVAVTTKAADQLAVFGGTTTTSAFKFKTYDQLNGDFKEATEDLTGKSKVTFKIEKVSAVPATGYVSPTITGTGLTTLNTVGTAATDTLAASEVFDKEFKWNATSATTKGTYKLTATLSKVVNGAFVEVGSAVSQVEIVDGTSSTIAYTVGLDKAVTDNKVFIAPNSTITAIKNADHTSASSLTALVDTYSDVAKKVKVSAVDGSKTVAIPASVIESVYVGNDAYASVAKSTAGDSYIVGQAEGTTAVTVLFATANGKQTTSMNVTAVKYLPAAETIAFTKTSKYITATNLALGLTVWNDTIAEGLKIVDQYGSEYVNDSGDAATDIAKFAADLGVVYYISDVKYDDASGTRDALSINSADGTISYTSNTSHVKSFKVNVVSNGKVATIAISTN